LVASHPGNTNAVKSGVHSPRLIQARAAEIEKELASSFDLSPDRLLAAREVARTMAILEAIDRELDERGLVGKGGKPSYLLDMRLRVSRQLEHWLATLAPEFERQRATDEVLSGAGGEDYLRELRLIGLGHDPDARPADRVKVLLELLRLDQLALTSLSWQQKPHQSLEEIEAEIARLDMRELEWPRSNDAS
jgi:hypothetical protein